MIFVKNEILKMWFLLKMRFWKCVFCKKKKNWDFGNVIFMKNGHLKCGFCKKCDFGNVIFVKKNVNFAKNAIFENLSFLKNVIFEHDNFWIKCGFLPQCDDDAA